MPRIRIIFEKKEWITFVNHMDLPTMFSRAARRTGLIQEFTEGFSPHPHISLGPPLAIGVEGKEEPADFWFKEWNDSNLEEWNKNMPHGIKILKCAEVDGPALAKLATAGTYTLNGCGFELDGRALEILEEEAKAKGELFASAIENGTVTLTVGDLEHCSAGSLVKALKEAGICEGWTDLRIVRERVGRWDSQSAAMRPLI